LVFALSPLAHAYAIAGRKQEAQQTLAKLQEIGKRNYVPAFDMAIIYTGMGDKEKALEWFRRLFRSVPFG